MFARMFSGMRVGYSSYNCRSWKPVEWIISRTFCSNVPDPPPKPKRPMGAFVRFYNENRKMELNAQQLKSCNTSVNLQFGKLWKNLTEEDRMPYEEAFAKDQLEYVALKQQWWDKLSDEQKNTLSKAAKCKAKRKLRRKLKKKMRLLGRPRRPPAAFYLFAIQLNNSPKNIKNTKQSFENDLHLWRNMSVEEKQPYFDKSKEDLKVYQMQHGMWELQMMKNGYGDLLQQAKKLWPSKISVTPENEVIEIYSSTDESEQIKS